MKLFSLFTTQKFLFFIGLFLFTASLLVSQNQQFNIQKNQNNFWENVRFGGGLGGGFSNGNFNISLSPTAVYDFNSSFSLGIGLNGIYSSNKTFRSTVLGFSAISLYSPVKSFQLSAEFEELNVNRKIKDSSLNNENYWYPALFLGLGYQSNNITFGVRYDVLYDEDKSILPNAWAPFIRVFF